MRSKQIRILVIFLIFANTAWPSPYNTVTIKTKTTTSSINIQYPQGFANKHIDLKIQTFIDKQKEPYLKATPLEEYFSSKDWIRADFKIKYDTPHVLSILFNFETYGRGAAHSNAWLRTLNFIDGQEVKLEDLFKPNSDYLSTIASYCYASLLKKGMPEENYQVKDGSKPIKANYKKWYFNKNGLVIVFDTGQITAMAGGPSFVTIPYSTLKSWPCTEKEKIFHL